MLKAFLSGFILGLAVLLLSAAILVLSGCSQAPKKSKGVDPIKNRGTCVRIGPKGTEIIDPCWR